MKKIISLISISFLLCSLVYAHSPKDIEVTPDFKSNNLKIEITHPVSNPRKRYVDKVSITVDDKEPIIKYFFFQVADKKTFTIQIPDLDKAKKIIIKARCKHGGSLEKEFNMQDFKGAPEK